MPDVATLQLTAYATLTFVGVCIASAALLFSYRQNFGWSPIVLVTSHGLGGVGGGEEFIVHLDFEFWNRQKYPIVIRNVEVGFGELRLHEKQSHTGEMLTWNTFRGNAIFRDDIRVNPSDQHQFKCRGAFPKRTLDDLDVTATISILYFDPVSNKTNTKIVAYRYSFSSES
ncbi:MAG: hypothetical protein KGZ91_07410 [Afipia sp.]|nr:hypothetical protein [Afipia sp.]